MLAFNEQLVVLRRQEEIQAELEACGEDMEAMSAILDELDTLSQQVAADINVCVLEVRGEGRAWIILGNGWCRYGHSMKKWSGTIVLSPAVLCSLSCSHHPLQDTPFALHLMGISLHRC